MKCVRETVLCGGRIVLVQLVWFEDSYCNPVQIEVLFEAEED